MSEAAPVAAVPGSPSGSSAAAWAIPPSALPSAQEAFVKRMTVEMENIGKTYGGPLQFLMTLATDEINAFADHLFQTYFERDDVAYHTEARIPPTTEEEMGSVPPVAVGVHTLGFSKDCTMKPPPGRSLFNLLIEQYLLDGFVTSSEPLLVAQSRKADQSLRQFYQGDNPLPTFSLAYIKGMARVCSLFALLYKVWKLGIELQSVHKTLYESVRVVYVHHIEQPSKMDEALKNMKLSCRGSIRKATNVIEVVMMLKNLYNHGMNDFYLFVRRWNSMSGRSQQIVGKRALTLKLLFELAPEV